jgi:phosphoribosyl 1,2-cyclic phosphodiesterase
MKVKLWGTRGSIPSPGPETIRYGGNTSCVGVTLSDGSLLVLDAGSGIRGLGLSLSEEPARLHVLLTHLHLDHILGLAFFAPLFRPQTEIVIWGPASPEASLRDRIARYISAPLSPVEVRELPCDVSFRHAPDSEWEIGPARIRAASVSHRGPTLGYRIDDGGSSLTYIPDHEPGLGADLDRLEEDWISGFALARDSSLLIHDGQYSDSEYPCHIGWGHSALGDALAFANRTGAERTVLFHHDPMHSDEFLDRLGAEARERWAALASRRDAADPADRGSSRAISARPRRSGEGDPGPRRADPQRQRRDALHRAPDRRGRPARPPPVRGRGAGRGAAP